MTWAYDNWALLLVGVLVAGAVGVALWNRNTQ